MPAIPLIAAVAPMVAGAVMNAGDKGSGQSNFKPQQFYNPNAKHAPPMPGMAAPHVGGPGAPMPGGPARLPGPMPGQVAPPQTGFMGQARPMAPNPAPQVNPAMPGMNRGMR